MENKKTNQEQKDPKKQKDPILQFLENINAPGAFERATQKIIEGKLEKGEAVILSDDEGIYSLERQNGQVDKSYLHQ
ncbi:hypothetical protein FACS1894152_4350 [Bacilli bacterium]|nr:hypothetical protein FACS1894152_4350 [Bacilli bacterium]